MVADVRGESEHFTTTRKGQSMLEVKPFCGWHFDPTLTGPLDTAVTPPYDVISPEERASLAENPYSFVHAILPKAADGGDPYAAAADRIAAWQAEGAIVQDDEPSFYLLRQRFTDLDGQARTRRGFFGIVKLPEPGEDYVMGHERTFDKPVADRLALTRAVQANLGAVFALYSDPAGILGPMLGEMGAREPDLTANTIDGVEQAIWRVSPRQTLKDFFADKRLYIADGHHRFQTACAYRDEMRAQGAEGLQPWDYALMGFVALEDEGLAIYPPHRVVHLPTPTNVDRFLLNLKNWFEVVETEAEGLRDRLESSEAVAIAMAVKGHGNYLLTLKDGMRDDLLGQDRDPAWRDLDVAVLHRGILEHILGVPEGTEFTYEKSLPKALAAVHEGDAAFAFLLRPTRAEQICACAEAGEAMPQKSTYFFPKLPSGGVFYRFTP